MCPTPQVGPEVTCEGAKGTKRKLTFHTEHEKMNFGDFCMFSLVNIPQIYHSRTFCYLPLKDISVSLVKTIYLF